MLILLDSWDLGLDGVVLSDLIKKFIHTESTSWTVAYEVYIAVRAVYGHMIDDSASFLDGARSQVKKLVSLSIGTLNNRMKQLTIAKRYSGRRKPTREMLQFLLHFEDCCSMSLSGLANAFSVLNDLSPGTDEYPGMDVFLREWPTKATEDIKFLHESLREIKTDILILREMVHYYLSHSYCVEY